MAIALPLFWGYVDSDGQLAVKRYTNDRQIENFERCEWVKGIFGPLEAYDIHHARQRIIERWKQEVN